MKRLAILLPSLLALTGCVGFSPDGAMEFVQARALKEEHVDPAKIADAAAESTAEARARALLGKPLSADAAVRVAFLRNKGLQAAYDDLGISEAKYVAASLPPNPSVSMLDIRSDTALDIERRLAVDILALATLPARQEIAADEWMGAKLTAAAATLKLATDVRRQYWRAVAARAATGALVAARAATEATADLAHKLGETGALNKLDQNREFAFYADLSAELAKARVQESLEKERLTRLLGLWGRDVEFSLPMNLPPLPRSLLGQAPLERMAMTRRVDIAMARGELDRVAKQYGLTRATRYINALELSAAENVTQSGSDKQRLDGAEIKLEIPLFDWGEARAREAEQTYMRAANRLAEKAVNGRSEVREAYIAYRGAFDVARLYESKVLPLRQHIQDDSMLHYNGMLTDLFALLQDARARISSQAAALDARRDFWLAETDLHAALNGSGMGAGDAKPSAVIANAAVAP